MAKANKVFNPDGKKVIISIDGGGIKGVIVAAMLAYLEDRLKESDPGAKIGDYFDFLAGTSTGGIIASAIAIGLSAQEILDIYLDRLPKAFGAGGIQKWIWYILRGTKYIYPIKPFLPILDEVFGQTRVCEITEKTLFLVISDVKSGTPIYVVSNGPGSAFTDTWPLRMAVLATAAAPVYFEPTLKYLVDGGISFNNPSFQATEEAMKFLGSDYGYTRNNVIHISLGTGFVSQLIDDVSPFGVINWAPFLIGKFMGDLSDQQAMNTQRYYGSLIDFRRYNPNLHAYTSTHLKLDSVSTPDLLKMEYIGYDYARGIDWNKPSVMPWDTPNGALKPTPTKRVWDGKNLV